MWSAEEACSPVGSVPTTPGSYVALQLPTPRGASQAWPAVRTRLTLSLHRERGELGPCHLHKGLDWEKHPSWTEAVSFLRSCLRPGPEWPSAHTALGLGLGRPPDVPPS